ncbi:protein-serine,threonine phosphatase [Sarracenia purpurea var. burkii]
MDIKPENMVICFEDQDSGRCLKASKDKKYTTKMRIIDFGSAMDVFTMKHLYDSVGPSRAEGKQQFGEGKQRNPAALVLVADRRCGTGALRRRRRARRREGLRRAGGEPGGVHSVREQLWVFSVGGRSEADLAKSEVDTGESPAIFPVTISGDCFGRSRQK